MKFTDCGLYVGVLLFLTLLYCKKGCGTRILTLLCYALLGFLPVTVGILIYFFCNHALEDLFNVYFYTNIFNYTVSVGQQDMWAKILHNEAMGLSTLAKGVTMVAMVLLALLYFIRHEGRLLTVFVVICILSVYMFQFMGYWFRYYPFPLALFMPFGILPVRDYLSKHVRSFHLSWGGYVASLLFFLLLLMLMRLDVTHMMFVSRKECAPYIIGEKIMEDNKNTREMLSLGMCDGVYTVCGVVPKCKYFGQIWASFSDRDKEINRYISKNKPEYLLSLSQMSRSGYRFVAKASFIDPSIKPLYNDLLTGHLPRIHYYDAVLYLYKRN